MAFLKHIEYFFIDHHDFIKNTYQNVSTNEGIFSFMLLPGLFSIVMDKKHSVHRKRTRDAENIQDEAMLVKSMYDKLLKDGTLNIKDMMGKYKVLDCSEVRELAKQLFERTIFNLTGVNGGNNSDVPLKCKVMDNYFLVPNKSRFFCGCVKEQCVKLNGNKYDIMIADPPWWNKYIRRLKSANDKLSYSMMYNEDIASIPVQSLFADNCLIAIWCTNSPSNIDAVKNIIFPKWGVEYIATWYWLKVTVDLQPIGPFGSGCKKQPYERLILGRVGETEDVPDSKLIVSVPSALHSHKPPLTDILSQYAKAENPQYLELFARYLLPNTTSVGYEPLKWQHISLYNQHQQYQDEQIVENDLEN